MEIESTLLGAAQGVGVAGRLILGPRRGLLRARLRGDALRASGAAAAAAAAALCTD